jgi:hypothetical protein
VTDTRLQQALRQVAEAQQRIDYEWRRTYYDALFAKIRPAVARKGKA